MWIELLGAMEHETSRHLIVTGELVTGPRTAQLAPGGPVGRQIEAGDTGLLDIERVDGYLATAPTRSFRSRADRRAATVPRRRPGELRGRHGDAAPGSEVL